MPYLQTLKSRFGVRGIVRVGTLGMCAVNVLGGGVAYALGRRKNENV